MKTIYKTCKHCAEEFSGRRDKKYCSNICKSNYHNEHNPKKTAFKSFCKNEDAIKTCFKNLRATIQTDLEETRKRKLSKDNNKNEGLDIELILLKNYASLSEIRKIERLLNIKLS